MHPDHSKKKFHIFTDKISIRWRDVDPFGMVNHSIFFTLMEEIRLKWYATTELQHSLKYFYPIVDAHITFENTIIYPADICIKLFTCNITGKSWTFYHELFNAENENEIYAKASLISVVYDPTLKQAIPIPSELITVLLPSTYQKVNL
jgi:acyl-CoA thioester hydrolase